MFRFEHIENLYYLGIIPVLILVFLLSIWSFSKTMEKIGNPSLVERLMVGYSKNRQRLLFAILLIAIALSCIAFANPQWGYKTERLKVSNNEIFIALDISLSMLSEDTSPNRLERSKHFAQKLAKEMRGNKVGLILFAGSAYLQVPVTPDISAVELFIKSSNTSLAGTQGTNIEQALEFAEESFTKDEENNKTIILITDGENHEEDALAKASELKEMGITIHAIGVGTSEGGFIPIANRRTVEYKKDSDGNPVKTSLNIEMIKSLGDSGGGKSFLLSNENNIISDLQDEINKMSARYSEQQSFSDYRSYYQYFLFIALLLILIEYLWTIGFFTKKKNSYV